MFNPRPAQQRVVDYSGGMMGVTAVPGAGKTQTLSYLAAKLILENRLDDDQEVLIVTLVNSAVDNFSRRVSGFMIEAGLLPGLGYRVRTLHGLAHDIVHERPDLAGLSDRFTIVDEREANEIMRGSVQTYLRTHPEFTAAFTDPNLDPYSVTKAQRDWPELAVSLASSFIRQAKDYQQTATDFMTRVTQLSTSLPLVEMGIQVYTDYQRALNYRSAVDFDDLIRLALKALQSDSDFLDRLRRRWPYILEDEAQDSSRLQEEILRLLSGKEGNWVRVGDPNQAIYETFTTASPEHLKRFIREPGVTFAPLPNSGRSSPSIIRLANRLNQWVRLEHPIPGLRRALSTPEIEPTPPGDPQPNPVDQPGGIHLGNIRPLTPDEELRLVINSLKKWLPRNQDQTVAVLVPRNDRGSQVVEELKNNGIQYVELLKSSLSTRQTARTMASVLKYLADPSSSARLAEMTREILIDTQQTPERTQAISNLTHLLRQCSRLETYLLPTPDQDWLAEISEDQAQQVIEELSRLRQLILRWQAASLLPVDQLILTIAQDLFGNPADLALAHKLALVLERAASVHPDWHLPEFTEELNTVANNERKFIGFSEEDTGFDPDLHKGKVVVATIHKAKGLEWDRVYLMSVNNYDFPGCEPGDTYISEKWYVRHKLNLEAEALEQLRVLVSEEPGVFGDEGAATLTAREDYSSERLRLLYVGITRAKKEISITWNSGRRGEAHAAAALVALREWWKENSDAITE